MDLKGLISVSMPAILALLQRKHEETNPGAPPLTDADVNKALLDHVRETVAKDDRDADDIRRRNPDIGSDVPGGGAV